MPATSRLDIRQSIRRQRRRLSAPQRLHAAQQLRRRLSSLPLFRRARHIACYIANDGEIDPMLIAQRLWAQGKTCYLPVIHRDQLRFSPYAPTTLMQINRYGIPEPRAPRLSARLLDLILLPLVAFDAQGNRLGMGGGYYDRTLAFLKHRRYWRKPRLIGLAYDFQRVPVIDTQPWDVPLDGVITEQKFYPAQRRPPATKSKRR